MASMQAQLVNMQEMYAQMQQMMVQQQAQQAAGSAAQESTTVKEAKSGTTKVNKINKHAALTGAEAPFPSLSQAFSMDLTFNVAKSIYAQSRTFKWKMLLLMLRVKKAVEMDSSRRWKRNPRWMLHMQGRHLASLWGHLGAARQLCFNPKVYYLADGEEESSGRRRN